MIFTNENPLQKPCYACCWFCCSLMFSEYTSALEATSFIIPLLTRSILMHQLKYVKLVFTFYSHKISYLKSYMFQYSSYMLILIKFISVQSWRHCTRCTLWNILQWRSSCYQTIYYFLNKDKNWHEQTY